MNLSIRLTSLVFLAAFAALAVAAAPFDGKYVANGKEAKLGYLIARKDDPFSGKPVTMLIFSEKDASQDKHPDFAAQMGHFGDALVVRISGSGAEWDVIGSELAHSALKHTGASASGLLDVKDVTVNNGEISGHLMSRPKSSVFDEPVEIDLRFHVKQP